MGNQNIPSSFLQNNFIWELSNINQLEVDQNLKDLLVRLYQNLNQMALVINSKESGIYPLQQVMTGNKYFQNPYLSANTQKTSTTRNSFRQTLSFGPLPNTGTVSIPHNIAMNSNFTLVRLEGCAINQSGTKAIPIPYASVTALADNIELNMDGTNINIITGADRTEYTNVFVVIELLKE